MSRQFQMYLLPADIESLIDTLRSRLPICLIQGCSPGGQIVTLESAVSAKNLVLDKGAVYTNCYIAPSKAADIRMRFLPRRSLWFVELESEVIEFHGCAFDGNVLVRGRFYLHTDLLVADTLIPKRKDFLGWADKVFRLAKKSLHRSKHLDAYVGEHAEKWRKAGGKFAWTVIAGRGPIYETEE